jgi:hypothetical protein
MIETVPSDKSNRFELIAIFIIATAAFIYFTGGAILNPTNVKWLYWGDPATSYLGWQFFRDTALLQFPLGVTPNYGVGFSASIMYTDSLPIIGIPLKFLSPLLPDQFQYFGAWIYLSFFFQIYFAWRILARSIRLPEVRVLASSLFLIAPILLYRLVHGGYGHIGLFSQFFILWSIDIHLSGSNRNRSWMWVLLLSLSTFAAIFPMVFILFLFSSASQLYRERGNALLRQFRTLMLQIFACGTALYVLGGTIVHNTRAGGLGIYRSSLSSIFDSNANGSFSWSALIPGLSDTPGSEEGFAFLGLSGLLIAPFGFVVCIAGDRQRGRFAMPSAAIAMAALALSNRVSIFDHEIFSFDIPSLFTPIFETLRSSGRFTWPLVYVLLLGGLRGLYISLQSRLPRMGLAAVFASLLLLQLIDMRSASSEIRERFTESGFTASLTDPKWNELAKQYKHLAAVPPLNNDPGWFELALLADKWHMTSNAAYYGRIDENRLMSENDRLQKVLNEQQFDSNTLYVITNYPPNPASPILLDQYQDVAANSPGAHVYELDGFVVVAP